MKRVGNLYHLVVDKQNIEHASIEASKTKIDHREVKNFFKNSEQNIDAIINNFHISGNYHYKNHIDESSGKLRELIIPPFYPDQIIHHAITQVAQPYLMKKIGKEICCSIKHRGTLYASKKVRKLVKKKENRYYVQFDIKKYFPSIKPEYMLRTLEKIFKDKQLLDCYSELMYSTDKGLPIGNYTSQMLSNIYLTGLDKLVKQTLCVKGYVRYADDFILIGANKRKLNRAIKTIKQYLKATLDLDIHENVKVYDIYKRPIDFCGYKHYKDHTTIRKRKWKKLRRCLLRLQTRNYYDKRLCRRLMSYYGDIKNSNSRNIKNRFLNIIFKARQCLRKLQEQPINNILLLQNA